MTDWIVEPASGLTGAVDVPGDKSIGHRAVLFGALCDGIVPVRGLSGGEDNLATIAALRALGVAIDDVGPGAVRIHGVGVDGLRVSGAPLDCGNSGTSMRLLSGLAAGQPFRTTLVGDEYLHRRPMRRVAEPLERMGAKVGGQPGKKAGELYPPLVIDGGSLDGIEYASPVASAQVKSAILIAGLYARGATVVTEPGPSRDHTERMFAYLGATVSSPRPLVARVEPSRLRARPLDVPGDPSSSAFVVAAALLAGAGVRVRGVCVNPTRTGFLDALAAMGARVAVENARDVGGEPVADLVVEPGAMLTATTLGGDLVVRAIDEVPVLAVVAARARGETIVRDASELRVKESDRVATTVRALRAFGVECEELPDGLKVTGAPDRPLRAATVDSAGDHRIAMASAIAALVADGPSTIRDVANVATSFPTFAAVMTALGARISDSRRDTAP
jgi:3-phosphoshikimate 1-carboxyvinyltransferase